MRLKSFRRKGPPAPKEFPLPLPGRDQEDPKQHEQVSTKILGVRAILQPEEAVTEKKVMETHLAIPKTKV
jgi:hypothetical protein